MKKIIYRFLLFILPVVIVGVALELLIRSIPNDYSYKKAYLDKNSNTIECLFLGSSHVYNGINPELISMKSFNAAHVGQTINFDYGIFKKYQGNWSNLKFLVLSVDYFTLLARPSTGVAAWRAKNYNIYYGLNHGCSIKERSEILSFKLKTNVSRIISHYIRGNSFITCSSLGYYNNPAKTKDMFNSARVAATKHTISNRTNYEKSVQYITNLISFAEINNFQIILYTSPAHNTYTSILNAEQLRSVIEVCEKLALNHKHCSYYNLLENKTFVTSDYRDADHLNKKGAGKLSLMLNNIIAEKRKSCY